MAELAQAPGTNTSASDESLINMPQDCSPSPLVVPASQYTPCGKLPSAFVQNFFVDFTDLQERNYSVTSRFFVKLLGNSYFFKQTT